MNKQQEKEFYKGLLKLFLYNSKQKGGEGFATIMKKMYTEGRKDMASNIQATPGSIGGQKFSDVDTKDITNDLDAELGKDYEEFISKDQGEFDQMIDDLYEAEGVDFPALLGDALKNISESKDPELLSAGFDPSLILNKYKEMQAQFMAKEESEDIKNL